MTLLVARTRIFRALAALTLVALAPLVAQAQDTESELDAVKREFLAIKDQLDAIKDEALETETVQDAFSEEESALKSELLASSPRKAETIEAFFEARSEFAAAYGNSSEEELNELQEQVEKLAAKIQGGLQKASQSESVTQAEQATKDAILAAMYEIEPKTKQLIIEQNELFARYQELTDKG